MREGITVDLDIAKDVSQVQGGDVPGTIVVQRKLKRSKVLAFFGKLPSHALRALDDGELSRELRIADMVRHLVQS